MRITVTVVDPALGERADVVLESDDDTSAWAHPRRDPHRVEPMAWLGLVGAVLFCPRGWS